ncbi:MAG: ATP-binding protein [Minicystis sp.]
MNGGFAEAEGLLSAILHHARTNVDHAAATTVKVYLHAIQDQYEKAVAAAIGSLRRFGIDLTPHPDRDQVRREYDKIWQRLGARRVEDLIDLPPMTDPDARAALDVLVAINSPALYTDNNLVCLTTCHSVNLSLEHGNAAGSCFAYVFFGMLLGPEFDDYALGFRFGKVGYDLVEQRGLTRYRAKVLLEFFLLSHWARPAATRRALAERAFTAALEVGDLTFACYAGANLISSLLVKGDRLEDVFRESERALAFAREAKFGMMERAVVVQQQLIRSLRGLTERFGSFDDAGFDEAAHEAYLARQETNMAIAVCWYFVWKAAARFMSGDYEEAIRSAEKAKALLWSCPSFDEVSECHYFGALALASRYHEAPPEERAGLVAALRAHQQQFRVWAEGCPETFFHKYALVSAEIARIEGDSREAVQRYEQAIRAAHENGFVQNEGIAFELAARFYRAHGFDLIAGTYLREARACYLRWGADGKVRQLDRLHPQNVERGPPAEAATFAARAEQLDLLAVVKASQIISGEIVQEKLVQTLLRVVLEQGGAQKAYLLLARGGALWIEAEATLDRDGVRARMIEPVAVESSRCVPRSLIHYVRRTKERHILDDAGADAGRFSADEYLARVKPRSVLCLPILRQAEVFGLLYLENNLVPGAFTAERLVALTLLASQAAVSLENALLLAKERAAREAAEEGEIRERAAREAAEEAERRAAFLAETSELLAESLDYEQVLHRLAGLSVGWLAAWCVIDVFEAGRIRRLVGMHADPAKQPLLEELEARYPIRPGSLQPPARVLHSGEPLLIPEMTDADIASSAIDAEHARIIRELGTRSLVIAPLVARGQQIGVISFSSAAPRRYGPAELDLAQELARRAASAIDNARLFHETQEAVRMRDEFLAVASHELRTPLMSLGLSMQALRRARRAGKPCNPTVTGELVERACRQSERINRLVDELLDVSRFEAGKLTLDVAEVELGALAREVVARLALDLTRSRCSVTIRDEATVVGRWDRSRLDQVITSLLSNAIKFGAGRPIEIAVRAGDHRATLAVTDHGIGIDPGQQARIFERFGRAVSVMHYGGIGLGLYICRRIVEAHGGSIRVESRPGAGSTFTIDLPTEVPEDGASTACARSSP